MDLLTDLLPHQRAAVDKLHRVRVGALFMDMGTGKSRTAIELAARRRDRLSRVVWYCPVSLRETVRQEILKHTRGEAVHVFDDRTREGHLPPAFWHIVGIESMSASRRVILAANSLVDAHTMVMVDESSYIKSPHARRTQWITRVGERARYRLLLTGTPLGNGVQDLYAQMRFLSPEILGYRSFYSFSRNHLEYSERYPGMVIRNLNTEWLAARIAPYTYQVSKEECLELPEKLYEARYCPMTREQRALYEQAKEEILLSLPEDGEMDSYTIFRLFTALQEITCGFWYRYPAPSPRCREPREPELLTVPHGRLELLLQTIREIPPGEKILIWAKYRRCIEEIAAGLREELGEEAATYYGEMQPADRAAALERFRGPARFFVATPSCGGFGHTLNEAAYSIHYTNDFKYLVRLQTEDRNHRIGQTREVTYIDIACADSIDSRISGSLARKGRLVEDFRRQVHRVRDKRTLRQALKGL